MSANEIKLATFAEAQAAQERREAEAAMDAMWASRDRTPTFEPVERGSNIRNLLLALLAGAVALARSRDSRRVMAAALIAAPPVATPAS